MVLNIGKQFFEGFKFLLNFSKNIGDTLLYVTANTLHERVAMTHIQFYRSNTGTVLSAIMLFLHQKVQLIEAVKSGTEFLVVVSKWFTQTQEGDTTFVLDFVGHGAKVIFPMKVCYDAGKGLVKILFLCGLRKRNRNKIFLRKFGGNGGWELSLYCF